MTTRSDQPRAKTKKDAAGARNDGSGEQHGRTHVPVEINVGAGLGVIAGAAAGAIAGPIGLAVGASLGAVIGEAAGQALHDQADERSARDHELDDAIGITSGPIGLGDVAGFVEPTRAAAFLRADHELLETLAETVLRMIAEGDHEDVATAVGTMQTAVLAHLDGEERDLLPEYAARAPEDAARIVKEHSAMRKTLAELDVGTDLHLVRAEAVAAFLGELRAHALRENAGLYLWAATAPVPAT